MPEKKSLKKRMAQNIHFLRDHYKLSREDFAKACKISARSLYYWENAERMPDAESIDKLCGYFKITPEGLFK